ncbi:MAG: arylsulfatase [Planctomycetota bacterium]
MSTFGVAQSQLPPPDPNFNGRIGKTYKDSTPDFPQVVEAPEDAPSVVVVLLDDVGFGQPGTFGGPVPTPNLDRLAQRGLRYNRFHTTGICSPTRAALLTGRNHHTAAFGTITELSTGYPGYHSVLPRATATVARILHDNGYSTSMFGKNHNTPDWETNPVGPFDRWPTGLGFDFFYGFHGGETSQWEPQLYRNTTPIEPEKTAAEGYHLTEDMVDQAITWMSVQQSIAPNKPFFLYFAPGAAHAPLHVPPEWIDRFKGKFDEGWDEVREDTLRRQKELGVVPRYTLLTPRPKEIEAWESLSDDAKKLYSRHMEVFAGFLAHTDYHIGRLLDAVQNLPGADNTIVIYVTGDNGPSAEGSLTGTLNNMMTQSGFPDSVEGQLAKIEEIGGPLHENHYPVGWSWAGSAPFQWMKRVPSHFGGTRNGMVISWPARIKDMGGLRNQFHHVIDIAPTILEAANILMPNKVDGIEQVPMAGVSLDYSFDEANTPGRRKTQYFETGGHRALYHDGWVASSFHGVPWQLSGSIGFSNNTWHLYHIDKDFSQANDLATEHPEKLQALQLIFDEEAEKFGVYPLDDRFIERAVAKRPSVVAGRTKFSYSAGTVRIPEGSAPPVYQRSHSIKADLKIPKDGAEGVIVACGGTSAGYSLYIKDGRLHYDYNFFGKAIYHAESEGLLPSGDLTVEMRYKQSPFVPFVDATGGSVELFINREPVGRGEVKRVAPVRFSATETMDIGKDLGATVTPAYRDRAPFAFTGVIKAVTIEISSTQSIVDQQQP